MEDIDARRRSSKRPSRGGGAARGEKGRGVVREVQGVVLPLYRAEREREGVAEAVGGVRNRMPVSLRGGGGEIGN
jgi:hypothetical protein